eukprot:12720974-Alexandrium_andersonii.AAC.1
MSASLVGSEMCIRDSVAVPPAALPGAGGAGQSAVLLALGTAEWGSPTFAGSEPRRGPFGPLGA